jgi:hypothetical protein
MITLNAILKSTACTLPIPVAMGAWFGVEMATTAALAALLMFANLASMAWVGPRFVQSLAAGEGGGLWGPMLFAKTGIMLGLTVELAQRLPAEGVALGLSPLFFGTVGALVFARPTPLATPQEV